METTPIAAGPLEAFVGLHAKATPLMRSMLLRASHITPPHSTLVTEHVNGCCIQCEGRPTFRRTLDGLQPTISFHWFIDCRRSNKSAVWRLTSSAAGVTPNAEIVRRGAAGKASERMES